MPKGIGYGEGAVGIAEYKNIEEMEGYPENSEAKQNRKADEQQDIAVAE